MSDWIGTEFDVYSVINNNIVLMNSSDDEAVRLTTLFFDGRGLKVKDSFCYPHLSK